MAREQSVAAVDNQQLDSANNVLRGWIPTRFYEEISGNFSPFTDDRSKPVRVAAAYIRELRLESERQKADLRRQKDKIDKLKDEDKIEILEATVKGKDETIRRRRRISIGS